MTYRLSINVTVRHIKCIVYRNSACSQKRNSADIFNYTQIQRHTHTHTHTYIYIVLVILPQQQKPIIIEIDYRNSFAYFNIVHPRCYIKCNTKVLHSILFLGYFSDIFLPQFLAIFRELLSLCSLCQRILPGTCTYRIEIKIMVKIFKYCTLVYET